MSETAHSSFSKHRVGGIVWILSIQYFIIEFLAQRAWVTTPYSLRLNTISDLGATACGSIPLLGTVACSPLHLLMNISFILSGVITIVGVYLVRSAFPKEWVVWLASWFITLGAIGAIGVGLFPENENIMLHLICALAFFLLSNFGLLLLGAALYRCSWRRTFAGVTTLLGVVGLAAFILLPLSTGVGIGVIERFIAYPITLWVSMAGLLLLIHPPRAITH